MTGNVIALLQAREDLMELAKYIASDNLDAGLRFLEAAERAFRRLASMPCMGVSRHFSNRRLAGIRSWPIRGFENYLVFYRPVANGIEVIRVLHGARDMEALFED